MEDYLKARKCVKEKEVARINVINRRLKEQNPFSKIKSGQPGPIVYKASEILFSSRSSDSNLQGVYDGKFQWTIKYGFLDLDGKFVSVKYNSEPDNSCYDDYDYECDYDYNDNNDLYIVLEIPEDVYKEKWIEEKEKRINTINTFLKENNIFAQLESSNQNKIEIHCRDPDILKFAANGFNGTYDNVFPWKIKVDSYLTKSTYIVLEIPDYLNKDSV